MKLTKNHLKNIQVELFYKQINALKDEEKELQEHYNIARNLACSEWEHGSVPSVCGGREGLRVNRMLPESMNLLQKNYDKHLEDLSYRRYALIKAYYPIIKDRISGKLDLCFEYWENTKKTA